MNFFDSVSSSIKWVDEYINHIKCETKMISDSTLLKIMKNNNTFPVFNKQGLRHLAQAKAAGGTGVSRHIRDPPPPLINHVYVSLVSLVPGCCFVILAPLWVPSLLAKS